MTPALELVRGFRDHEQFCRDSLRLRDRSGSRLPLECWPSQRKLTAAIERQEKAGKPVRILVLKTRRSGFTVGSCSHIFRRVPFFAGRQGFVVADHYRPAALEAFDYLQQFSSHYQAMGAGNLSIKLPALKSSGEMKLEWENESMIEIYSSDRGEIRGGGRHWGLFDEVAFWRAADVTLRGAINMVPDLPETGIIVQSTANGVGGEFYDLCQRAQNPATAGGWTFLFFGWLEDANNYRPFEDPKDAVKFQSSLDADELVLHNMLGAKLEQLHWRRWKIDLAFNGRVDDFRQEYPSTPQEAFITSGHPVFDRKDLARHPIIEGTPGDLEVTDERPYRRLLFTPSQHGALTIFKRPEKGRMYVIGGDPSKGIDVSDAKRGDNPDYSAGFVADQFTGEQVAMYRERSRPMRFAEQLALLGRYYNWAYLIPEANDPGFIDALLNQGYPLELIYHRQRDPTNRRPPIPEEVGFLTTGTSREWLISAAEEAIRGLGIIIHSAVCVRECHTFVIKPNGKKEHQDNCHDDTVITVGLTAIGMRYAPKTPYVTEGAARQHRIGKYGGKRRDDDD